MLTRIVSLPGIKRDGTLMDGEAHVDALWCRWQRKLPRKMGGFRELRRNLTGVARTIHSDTKDSYTTVHVGSGTALERVSVDNVSGAVTGVVDRTPAGFVGGADFTWQFDSMYDTGTSTTYLLAHAAPNIANIANSVTGDVYYGDLHDTAPLVVAAGLDVSGGIVILHPYAVRFGSDGFLSWSVPGLPTDFAGAGSGAARVTESKLVCGVPLRAGPGNTPSGLFLSLSAVIRMSFVGGTAIFDFDTLSVDSSIMSSSSMMEYDGAVFWMGLNRAMVYNGTVKEVPNELNINWFLDNLNWSQRQKVFAIKMPRWGEIWWCFPFGSATECTHAIIYNVRENTWYDTELPNGGRSAGSYNTVYQYPIMTSNASPYSLWQHETGTDEVSGDPATTLAVRSYYETAEISFITAPQPQDATTAIGVIEPDFVQSGDMTLTITGRANARAPEQVSDVKTFSADTQTVNIRTVRRLMRFKFESNVAGGDYQTGHVIAHIDPADTRIKS